MFRCFSLSLNLQGSQWPSGLWLCAQQVGSLKGLWWVGDALADLILGLMITMIPPDKVCDKIQLYNIAIIIE